MFAYFSHELHTYYHILYIHLTLSTIVLATLSKLGKSLLPSFYKTSTGITDIVCFTATSTKVIPQFLLEVTKNWPILSSI